MDWIDLAQEAGCCEHSNEPLVSIKFGEFLILTSCGSQET
jgi:hypothetical protein